MSKKEIRKIFNHIVFSRDANQCRYPGCTERAVDAHHITDRHEMPNGGYVLSNGISLCSCHHWEAEEFHRTRGKSGLTPDYFYALIGSSFNKAYEDSEKLDVHK